MGHCDVPTRLEVTETPTTLAIAAYAHNMSPDACQMNAKSVFVALKLEGGLRGREVVDALTNEPARVVDCATDPLPGWCIAWEDYDMSTDPHWSELVHPSKGDRTKRDRRDRYPGMADDHVW
jgi:hypothetical protein